MTPKMLTLTNILLILAGCHLALGKDSEDDTIRFPSYNEINYSPRIHSYHYKPLISKLRNPSNKARFELPHINNEDENIKKNEVCKNYFLLGMPGTQVIPGGPIILNSLFFFIVFKNVNET